ncbi:MAG: heparinase II/III family protein [Armatimonadetes bacterium]|nr:heparinase II/III family protein [Armatimonadota bacterium]
MATCVPVSSARDCGGIYTAQRIANTRRNCSRYGWARDLKAKALEAARPWKDMSDEALWRMVPGQDLPRCIDVSWDYNLEPHRVGCLNCGSKIDGFGNYPYRPDIPARTWKLTCPSCGAVFPTNDFGKYYQSAIDEHGLFNPAKGDRSLLFNTDHPDPSDPLHTYGVDDGFGYKAADGRTYKFVGYYTWKLWRELLGGLQRLSEAYLYTGDKTYARKAAIILDRIADVYPSMDWKTYADMGWYHSDGSSHKGKIEGCIWETGVVRWMADSYDMILSGTVDNPELYAFLSDRAKAYALPRPKGTRDLFVANVDDNILRCAAQAIKDGRIRGNEGMHQSAMAALATALNTDPETSQWLDYIFAPEGGAIPGVIVGKIDRDGFGGEGAPGYSLLWNSVIADLAERLATFPAYNRHSIFRDFPQFRRSYTSAWRACVLGLSTPSIGDSGATGLLAAINVDPERMARGFYYLRDAEIARATWEANGKSAKGLHGTVFDPDPEKLAEDIEKAAKSQTQQSVSSRNLAGFGLADLESGGAKDGTALWLYYGRMDHHGHADRLNIGMYAFGVDLAPDLGYPEFAADWPHRYAWTNNTLSHNTVIVDGAPQERNLSGRPLWFRQFDGIGAAQIESPGVYPGTSLYGRTIALVQSPGGAYGVDIFRVAGGKEHVFSFHGPPGPLAADGLSLTAQPRGTYAGPNIAFASLDAAVPLGFSFLYNVSRDTRPSSSFALDWKAEAGYRSVIDKDDIHLRLHSLTSLSEVALADGDPPQNKPGNPRRIRYALLKRSGQNLASAFVSILEPYKQKPFIDRASSLLVSGSDSSRAVRVALKDGSVDCILSSVDGQRIEAGGITTDASLAFLRFSNGRIKQAALFGGTSLQYGDFTLNAQAPIRGKVVKWDEGLNGKGRIWVQADIADAGALTGEQIVIENDGALNACYDIRSVIRDGKLWCVDCGDVSFVRGYLDASNYDKGFTYNFNSGAGFTIYNSAEWTAKPER